jgi:hypothetical protein
MTTPSELRVRKAKLFATVQEKLPNFVRMCTDSIDVVLLHQDSFAAGYQDEEYFLLGMAIKYAGSVGKAVHVMGTNHETLHRMPASPAK